MPQIENMTTKEIIPQSIVCFASSRAFWSPACRIKVESPQKKYRSARPAITGSKELPILIKTPTKHLKSCGVELHPEKAFAAAISCEENVFI